LGKEQFGEAKQYPIELIFGQYVGNLDACFYTKYDAD
jgi:hypothetical protein